MARKATTAKKAKGITIRMYCQGLGDCFLLTFPRKGAGVYRILIDCGVLQRTPLEEKKMLSVVNHLAEDTGGEIDLLIVTHEHWDHVAGFSHGQSIFEKKIKFGKVWLSWAENPNDADAKLVKTDLGKKKDKVQKGLHAALKLGFGKGTTGVENELRNTEFLMGFLGLAKDPTAKKTDKKMSLGDTMDWLRAKVQPGDFCNPGECRTLPDVEDIKIYVLGPPKNIQSIRKMDPTGDEGYRHRAGVSFADAIDWLIDGKPGAPPCVFSDQAALSVEDAKADPFFREFYGFADDPLNSDENAWRRIDGEWLEGISRLALQLDTGINNTSLALAFELPDGRTLIFPGDAQIGNWLSWDSVQFTDSHGKPMPTTAKQLLNRAVFYKVGHHGSHNATRKVGGLEEMTSGNLVAMIPTDEEFALTQSPPHGWKMPFVELNEALKRFTNHRILRVDRNEKAMKTPPPEEEHATASWKGFLDKVTFSSKPLLPEMPERPLFVEYEIS